jgi:hypothetical protein
VTLIDEPVFSKRPSGDGTTRVCTNAAATKIKDGYNIRVWLGEYKSLWPSDNQPFNPAYDLAGTIKKGPTIAFCPIQ